MKEKTTIETHCGEMVISERDVISLAEIQALIKAPKDKRNDFGKYQYRSAEDILEAVKQLLAPLQN